MTPAAEQVALAVAGMAAITYAVRVGGLLLARSMPSHPAVTSFLSHLGGAVMVALVAAALGRSDWPGGVATIVAVAVAAQGRPTLALVVGMAAAAMLRAVAS